MNANKEIHLGTEVKQKLKSRGMSVAEFARRINRSRNNVYNIFKRQYIDIELLQTISAVLEYDFIHNL